MGAFTAYTVERLRLSMSAGEPNWISQVREIVQMSDDPENRVLDAFVHSLAKSIQSSRNDLHITNALNLLDEHATLLIDSTEALFGILAALQALIDHSSKKHADSEGLNYHISDTIRSQALITYTNLLIQFPEISVNVRLQFVKALIEMINRRVLKKKDYVNSQLRAVACECLSEIELVFPGEVAELLKLQSWLTSPMSSHTPPAIIDAIQDETSASFENYTKLLLTCCLSFRTISEKPLLKTLSLLLDSIEFGSSWHRHRIAVSLEALIAKGESDTSSVWNHAVILHHFSRLVSSDEVSQVHAFLAISLPFAHEWSSSTDLPDLLIDRLMAITIDPHVLSTPVRLLSIAWLNTLVSNPFLGEIVYSKRFQMIPISVESSHVIEAKLSSLLYFASVKERLPRRLLRLIPLNTPLPVIFRYLTKVLIHFAHLDLESLLQVPEYLTDMVKPTVAIKATLPSLIKTLQITSTNVSDDGQVYNQFLLHLGIFVSQLIQPPGRTLQYFPLLCVLAVTKQLDPNLIIASVSRLLNEGEIPLETEWEDGLKILELLRLITINHSSDIRNGQVSDILNLVANKFHNVDIRDRAHLFHRYVECKRTNFFTLHNLNDDGICGVPEPAVECPIRTPSPPNRSSTSTTTTTRLPNIRFTKNIFRRKNELKIHDNCWAIFSNNKTPTSVLPFILEFGPSSSDETDDDPQSIETLFGVELIFSTCEGFVPFKSVEIPYLEKPRNGKVAQGFPHKYNVDLELNLVLPLPGDFSVSLTFTDSSGDSHSMDLEPFSVELEDLFLPVPVEKHAKIFSTKFKDPFAKLLPIRRELVEQILNERLSHFVVSANDKCSKNLPPLEPFDFDLEALLHGEENCDTRYANVLISLPPTYHLMFRFVIGPSTTIVWISTDLPDVLVLLDDYFDKWNSDLRITNHMDRLISG